MRTAGVAFLLSLVVAGALTPLVRRFALRLGLLDHAIGSRKIHGRPVPRLGGLAIMAGFYSPLLALAIYETGVGAMFYAHSKTALALLGGGLVIGALGVYDDIRGANAYQKFAVQIVLALWLYWAGFRVEVVAVPFGAQVSLGFIALPLTVLWIVGVINALNLIDGMDGLAAGVALFAIAANLVIAVLRLDPLMTLFMAALGGAVLGFLFYNFNPASIFMGDTGSMFLGLVLAVSSLQTSQKSSTAVAFLVPIVVLGLPIADTLLALVRRAARGLPLFSADREHVHHRLLALGLSQRKTVVVLYGTCVLLAAGGLLLSFATGLQATLLLCALVAAFLFFARRLGYLRVERAAEVGQQRRRNLVRRAAVRSLGQRLRSKRGAEEIWRALGPVGDEIGARAMVLTLSAHGREGVTQHHRYVTETEQDRTDDDEKFWASFELKDALGALGRLEICWLDGRSALDRDDELTIESLCGHLAQAWRRSLKIDTSGRGRPNERPETAPQA